MALFGKWEVVSAENWVTGMKATGMPDNFIKPTKGATFVLEISKSGDEYCKSESINMKLNDVHFKSGKSFETKNWLEQTQNWTIDMDGDKMVEKRKVDHDVVVTNYEAKDGLLEATYKPGRTAPCTVKYKRV